MIKLRQARELATCVTERQSRTGAEVALQIAKRVRASTEASSDARQPKVTVNLGIASTRGEDTRDVSLKRANIALYEAKSADRNRLRLAL